MTVVINMSTLIFTVTIQFISSLRTLCFVLYITNLKSQSSGIISFIDRELSANVITALKSSHFI